MSTTNRAAYIHQLGYFDVDAFSISTERKGGIGRNRYLNRARAIILRDGRKSSVYAGTNTRINTRKSEQMSEA